LAVSIVKELDFITEMLWTSFIQWTWRTAGWTPSKLSSGTNRNLRVFSTHIRSRELIIPPLRGVATVSSSESRAGAWPVTLLVAGWTEELIMVNERRYQKLR
jgi:hypothetical protein